MIPIDGFGFTGLVLDYAVIIFFSLGSLVLFTYCWWKKRLDFDEDPKYQMLKEDPPYE